MASQGSTDRNHVSPCLPRTEHVIATTYSKRWDLGKVMFICTSQAHDVETNDKLQRAAAREEPGGERKLGEQGPGVKGNVDDG